MSFFNVAVTCRFFYSTKFMSNWDVNAFWSSKYSKYFWMPKTATTISCFNILRPPRAPGKGQEDWGPQSATHPGPSKVKVPGTLGNFWKSKDLENISFLRKNIELFLDHGFLGMSMYKNLWDVLLHVFWWRHSRLFTCFIPWDSDTKTLQQDAQVGKPRGKSTWHIHLASDGLRYLCWSLYVPQRSVVLALLLGSKKSSHHSKVDNLPVGPSQHRHCCLPPPKADRCNPWSSAKDRPVPERLELLPVNSGCFQDQTKPPEVFLGRFLAQGDFLRSQEQQWHVCPEDQECELMLEPWPDTKIPATAMTPSGSSMTPTSTENDILEASWPKGQTDGKLGLNRCPFEGFSLGASMFGNVKTTAS